jgi:hypothetical protein
MRQFRLATIITGGAMAAVGCGRESGPDGSASRVDSDRPATRVLRPDEVKISLGLETPAKAAPAATDPAAASESSAP